MSNSTITSRLSPGVLAAISAGPALLPPTHPDAISYGKKRETAKEFATRVVMFALSETGGEVRMMAQAITSKAIADYKEHYHFPYEPQGEGHMHDCIMGAVETSLHSLRSLPQRTREKA